MFGAPCVRRVVFARRATDIFYIEVLPAVQGHRESVRWLERLRRVLGREKDVVIGKDSNAKSEWWGKGKRDNRGSEL